MDWNWWYFVLGVITWPFLRLLAHTINQSIIEWRQKKFLKLVSVRYPNHKDITFISVDTSDKRAMQKLERQIREQYGVLDQVRHGDSSFDGVLRREDTRRREDPSR